MNDKCYEDCAEDCDCSKMEQDNAETFHTELAALIEKYGADQDVGMKSILVADFLLHTLMNLVILHKRNEMNQE